MNDLVRLTGVPIQKISELTLSRKRSNYGRERKKERFGARPDWSEITRTTVHKDSAVQYVTSKLITRLSDSTTLFYCLALVLQVFSLKIYQVMIEINTDI